MSALAATLFLHIGSAPAIASSIDSVDRIREDQWHLHYLRISEAHKFSKGEGVTVAVPDTGLDPHPDLNRNVTPGTDLTRSNGNGLVDQDSHGTGMAGLIAASGLDNNRGALGIAPRSKVLPVRTKVTNEDGDSDLLAAGITFAAKQSVDVISVSSIAEPTTKLQKALDVAVGADIVVVAAAGNRPRDNEVKFPAAHPNVIAVGGIDRNGEHVDFSVSGPELDVSAPAVDIYSTSYAGKYRKGTGTSEATAIVAGAVALIRARFPSLPAREVVHRLTATAVDKGPPGRDDQYGHGVIDLVAALTADVPPLGSVPTADPPAGDGPTVTTDVAVGDGPGAKGSGEDGSGVRGWVTLGVLLAAGGGWAYVVRRRRSGDDPPPRISR
ncbi:S8 family serine peptidase [Micromonospora sp. SH-82]|uniref:S8 family serine peptidase n=1 Tax=Micromonospora sp. SH-82 TaxID=3132938 RepID=UPI003EB84E64